MRFDRILAIAKKNLRSLKHDKRTIGFLVLMPLLMITIFGYTFGGNIRNVDVYIVNLDRAPVNVSVSAAIVASLETRDTLHIVKIYGPADAGIDPLAISRDEVKDTHIWATIVFNETFSEDVATAISGSDGRPAMIQLIVDGTNPNIVQAISNDILTSVRALVGTQASVTPISISTALRPMFPSQPQSLPTWRLETLSTSSRSTARLTRATTHLRSRETK